MVMEIGLISSLTGGQRILSFAFSWTFAADLCHSADKSIAWVVIFQIFRLISQVQSISTATDGGPFLLLSGLQVPIGMDIFGYLMFLFS